MTKRNNIEKAVDDATEHVVAAADDLKAGATAVVEGLDRATQKKLRNVRAATETAWDEAGSTAKKLHSKGLLYVRIHPLETVVLIFGAILSVSNPTRMRKFIPFGRESSHPHSQPQRT